MFENIRADFKNNNGIISKLTLLCYRFGHWVLYNCKPRLVKRPLWVSYKACEFVARILSNSEIPAACHIGKGFTLEHGGNGVIIHPKAVIGDNCRFFHQVTLGVSSFAEDYGYPVIGDNVYIGAGAKIIGNVTIGDDVRIGANAVVLKSIEAGWTAVGMPARQVKYHLS